MSTIEEIQALYATGAIEIEQLEELLAEAVAIEDRVLMGEQSPELIARREMVESNWDRVVTKRNKARPITLRECDAILKTLYTRPETNARNPASVNPS